MSVLDVSPPRLAPGEPVDVQNRFDGSWCSGFEIAEVLGSPPYWTYRIRRLSDGAVLPRIFDHDAIAESKPATGLPAPVSMRSRAHPSMLLPTDQRLAS